MKIKFVNGGPEFKCSWMTFKAMILGDKDLRAKSFKEAGYKGKPFKMYDFCDSQIRKGVGVPLYYDNLANLNDGDEDDDE